MEYVRRRGQSVVINEKDEPRPSGSLKVRIVCRHY